jgi:hypothetical protein
VIGPILWSRGNQAPSACPWAREVPSLKLGDGEPAARAKSTATPPFRSPALAREPSLADIPIELLQQPDRALAERAITSFHPR